MAPDSADSTRQLGVHDYSAPQRFCVNGLDSSSNRYGRKLFVVTQIAVLLMFASVGAK